MQSDRPFLRHRRAPPERPSPRRLGMIAHERIGATPAAVLRRRRRMIVCRDADRLRWAVGHEEDSDDPVGLLAVLVAAVCAGGRRPRGAAVARPKARTAASPSIAPTTATCGSTGEAGQVSLCNRRPAGWLCQAVPDDRTALEAEIARLQSDNAVAQEGTAEPQPAAAEQHAPGAAGAESSRKASGRSCRTTPSSTGSMNFDREGLAAAGRDDPERAARPHEDGSERDCRGSRLSAIHGVTPRPDRDRHARASTRRARASPTSPARRRVSSPKRAPARARCSPTCATPRRRW